MKQQFLNDSGLTELIGYIKEYVKDDQDVKPYASLSVFPKTGEQNIIYIDTTTNFSYYWDNNTKTYKALDVQTWANLTGKPSTFPPSSHTHDDRYYTETEINTKLAAKANSSHKHVKADITDFPTSMPASDVPAWAKASSKPSYSWPEISGKPGSFTPSAHTHTIANITNLQSTLDSKALNSNTIKGVFVDDYWGLATPASASTNWIRTTSSGLLPYQYGGAGNGHSALGTPSWYFKEAYIQNVYANQLRGVLPEAYLAWGGKNFSGTYGPIDAAMIPNLGANRLAFGAPAGIKIEYSRNSGSTWTDYGANDDEKRSILCPTGCSAFTIGKADSSNKATAAYMLRITLDTDKIPVYTALNKFAIYISSNGSNGCYCTIDASLESTPTTFVKFADKTPISGWSGWNIINTSDITTYGNTPSNQYGLVRFTFGCTSGSTAYNGLQVYTIHGFGGQGWSTPSNMAKAGSIYEYDRYQNTSFPAQVTATQFNGKLNGVATKLGRSGDMNYPMTFYWYGQNGQPSWLWGSNDGSNIYIYNPSNFSVKYAASAGSANAVTWENVSDKPSSMPASDVYSWAKASTKPAYSWSEINNKPSTFTPSSHTHGSGDITSLSADKITGVIGIDHLPAGALERCKIVADDTARFKLTKSDIQNGDTVKVGTDANARMYFVIDDTKLSSEAGYTIYTAGSATSVPWSGVTGKPSTFTPSSHTHDDRYYTESEMNTKLAGKSDTGHTHSQYLTSHQDISGKVNNNADGADSLLSKIAAWTATPTDDTYFIRQDTAGTNTFGRVKFSTLWNYIKAKGDSIYAKVAHSHKISEITDIGNASVNYANSAGSAKTATSAGSCTGNAATATALTSSAGSASQPVYFSGGKPVACSYTINASVPSGAKFTDTNTWRGIQNNLTSDSTSDSLSAAQGKVLKGLVDGKAASNHTHTISQITDISNANVNAATTINSATPTLSTGIEKSAITVKSNDNGVFKSTAGDNASIRTAMDFKWYDTNWQIGNIRGNSVNSVGFGFAFKPSASGTLVLKSYIDTDGTYHGNITGNASTATTATKLQTYKQGSTTETYGTQYPLYAQWEDSSNARLKIDNYTVKVNYADKAGSVEWGNITNKRRCYVGQSGSTKTKPWYKFASFKTTAQYEDRRISFKVSGGFGSDDYRCGVLTAHLRTGANKNEESVWFRWEYATNLIDPSKFVLIYKNTTNTSTDVELWVKIDEPYTFYHFTVLTEEYRDIFADYSWTLYNQHSAGYADAPTSGYTQVYSKVCHLGDKMSMLFADGYYGMITPSGSDGAYIRTTSNGLLPYKSGGARSGHSVLGTSSWYFSSAYIDNVNVAASVKIGQPNNSNNGAIELYGSSPYIDFHAGGTNTDYTSRIIAYSDRIEFVFA